MVAVLALVVAGDLAVVGGGADGRDGPFVGTGHRRGVVAVGFQGRIAHVMAVGHDIQVAQEGGLLQIAVGDVAGGVGGGDQGSLDVGREGVPPVITLAGVVEIHAAHAGPGCVSGAQQGGLLGDQFGQVGGARAQASSEATKGVEVAAHEGGDADPVVRGLVLGDLERAEEARRAADGCGHKAEAAKDTAPDFGTDALDALQLREDGVQSLLAMGRELDGFPGRVDDPAEDELAGAPAAIAREEFLQGDCFIALVIRGRLGEHFVDTVEQVAAKGLQAVGATLAQLDEVIDKDVRGSNRVCQRLVGGWGALVRVRGCASVGRRGQSCQRQACGCILLPTGLREGVTGAAVRVGRVGFQAVGRGVRWAGGHARVAEVGDRFGHCAERGRGLDPTHRARHGDGYELSLSFVPRQDDSQSGAIMGIQEHAVEAVFDVELAQVNRAVLRVCVAHSAHYSLQGPAKLHGFRRGVGDGGLVDRVPGVVAEETRFSSALLFDSRRGQLELGHVTDQLIREHHPKLVLNELGHLFPQK